MPEPLTSLIQALPGVQSVLLLLALSGTVQAVTRRYCVAVEKPPSHTVEASLDALELRLHALHPETPSGTPLEPRGEVHHAEVATGTTPR